MNTNVHFSSDTDEWPTPQDFFDEVGRELGPFDLDPCCTPTSAKEPKFFTKEDDGLTQRWEGKVWMNPPYGRTIKQWMKKAYESSLCGAFVVCLIPSRTDTAWWHDYAMKGEVRFIRGRLKFGNATENAPFPSALVIFHPQEIL
jgi:phage N-6-adenine-methyltransferase